MIIGRVQEKISSLFHREHYGIVPILRGLRNKLFPSKKVFCPLPFKHMEIMPGGHTNLCCYIKKSPGVVDDNNLLEVYNSPTAQKIRKSMLNGSMEYCDLKNCPHYTSGNLPLQKDCTDSIYADIIKNQTTKLDYVNLWLSFDARCNLTCISCRNDIIRYNDKQSEQVAKLMKMISENIDKMKHIGFNGAGDPFTSPPMRDFLFSFDSSKHPQVDISLLTNGILFNEKTWERMEKSRGALRTVQVSIDGASEITYEKVRRGSSWEKLTTNLRFLSKLRKENAIKEFIISFVVNAWNFREMPDFVRFAKELGCDQVYFSHIVDWGVMGNTFEEMAVHLPENPLHQEFRKVLRDPIFDEPFVELGNVKEFKQELKHKRILRESMFS